MPDPKTETPSTPMTVEQIEIEREWAKNGPEHHPHRAALLAFCDQAVLIARASEGMPSEPETFVFSERQIDPFVLKSAYKALRSTYLALAGKVEELTASRDKYSREFMLKGERLGEATERAEQAKAALATARREERERCAKVCEANAHSEISEPFMRHCADLIRALPEEGK